MSLTDTIARYFSNHAETRENHKLDTLKTNYYKTNQEKAINALEQIFNQPDKFEITSISRERGEMSIISKHGKKVFIVATAIMVRPYRTAVDFSVTTESIIPFDFGYSSNLIKQLYNELQNVLPLIEDAH
ncbi:cytosolic protein [Oceanobacillus piezotolerans]|uniref:Cytosolic protein n=1 Tax=Oceanobacillus piezotolerans TaxID=2448030 RepID=A0A498DEE3_9BACI|nr:cytosolic protein [Oceanobacillus piezotolerans]RLL47895.1 cytosolic protein [Oceanobacillus piezotolerans]